jgi:hypothetical protein
MSITADPLFIAAEVQWRTEKLSGGLATARPARHHAHLLRAVMGRMRHANHGRQQARPGSPRTA